MAVEFCSVRLVSDGVQYQKADDTEVHSKDLNESTVLPWIQKVFEVESVSDMTDKIKDVNHCCIYYGQRLITCVDRKVLKAFAATDGVKSGECNLQKLIEWSHPDEEKEWDDDECRLFIKCLNAQDFTQINKQLTWEQFDFWVYVAQRLDVKNGYLNEMIIRSQVIPKMVSTLEYHDDFKTQAIICKSEMCTRALLETLNVRRQRVLKMQNEMNQRMKNFNGYVIRSAAEYEGVIDVHLQLTNTRGHIKMANVEGATNLNALMAGRDNGILRYFLQVLGKQCKENSDNGDAYYNKLGYNLKVCIGHWLFKHQEQSHSIMVSLGFGNEYLFDLIMMELHCSLNLPHIEFERIHTYALIRAVVTQKRLSAENIKKIIDYVIHKCVDEGMSFQQNYVVGIVHFLVPYVVKVTLLNGSWVKKWMEYLMKHYTKSHVTKRWQEMTKDLDGSEKFEHSAALSHWFAYGQSRYYPRVIVDWWEKTIGFTQWQVPVQSEGDSDSEGGNVK